MSGTGPLHLEVSANEISKRGVNVSISEPRAVFKESCRNTSSKVSAISPNNQCSLELKLERLDNKTVDNNSLKIKSIRKKIVKNSSKIKEIYLEEIKRHIQKAEKLSKSETIPPSPYKELLTKAPSYIANRMLKEIAKSTSPDRTELMGMISLGK